MDSRHAWLRFDEICEFAVVAELIKGVREDLLLFSSGCNDPAERIHIPRDEKDQNGLDAGAAVAGREPKHGVRGDQEEKREICFFRGGNRKTKARQEKNQSKNAGSPFQL